jgi:hypothetical protein
MLALRYRQHGASGSRRTIGGEFASMGALMTAAGRDQHRHRLGFQNRRRRQHPRRAQNPRPKTPTMRYARRLHPICRRAGKCNRILS